MHGEVVGVNREGVVVQLCWLIKTNRSADWRIE